MEDTLYDVSILVKDGSISEKHKMVKAEIEMYRMVGEFLELNISLSTHNTPMLRFWGGRGMTYYSRVVVFRLNDGFNDHDSWNIQCKSLAEIVEAMENDHFKYF
jgi:hypothetical protein